MHDDCYLVDLVKAWADKIGRREALLLLMSHGISDSTASKLVRGKYSSKPGHLISKIIKEVIKKDGFFNKEVN